MISFGMSSMPKLSKYVTILPLTYNESQWVPLHSYSSSLTTYALYYKISGTLFLE